MAEPLFMSDEERKRKEELRQRTAIPGGAAALYGTTPEMGVPRSLADQVTDKKPDAAEQTSGLRPTDSTEPSGGVSSTVTQTQQEVKSILGPKPSPAKLREAVSAYEKAADQLKEQAVDTTAIDQSLADARAAYRESKNRNELLSLVQMIGQSFAKLAAYNYGAKRGRYIGDQVQVPSVDYEGRTGRALEEYKMASGEARDQRRMEMDRAEKRYQIEKDKVQSLRERIGSEEAALGRETSLYSAELAAQRAADAAAKSDERATAREVSAEERFNRQYGAKAFDNAQQEESLLTKSTTALRDEKRARTVNLDQLATQAGIDEPRLAEIRAQAEKDAAAEDTIWTDEDRLVREKTQQALLGEIRNKLTVVREKQRVANEMMRTGKSFDEVRSQPATGEVTPASTEKRPTPEQIARYVQQYPQVTEAQATQILTDRLNGR